MKKVKIPRLDHEVYFIPVPEALKPKLIRSFVVAQMEKLHPGFSAEAAMDIKRLVFNKTKWVMATVMEAETLAEYRILHNGCVLFTNTSIAVHKKDFTAGGVKAIGDELIGYDSEIDSPVSIPLEPGKSGGSEGPPKTVKTVPAECKVFAGRMPVWRVTTMIVCAVLLALIPLFFFPAAKEMKEAVKFPFVVKAAESPPELKHPPAAIEILAEFSAALVRAGGKVTRWQYSESLYNEGQYNDNSGRLVIIETRGIDVISLRQLFNQYRYVVLEDISDIRYIDGEPYLTVFLNAVKKGYLRPPAGTFFSQSFSLPIFSDLANELRRHEISIVSETLPSAENGNALYTLAYTAKDSAFIRSMEIITGICDKYPVRVRSMDVSIGGDSDLFTVVCSLSQSDAPRYVAMGDGNSQIPWDNIPLDNIPKAFGYKEIPPPPPPPKVVEVQPQAPQAQQVQQAPKPPEVSVVGTIRDGQGQILFYRDKEDNKIKTMESFAKP